MQTSIVLFNERFGEVMKSNDPQDLQLVTINKQHKQLYLENTVTFDYGVISGLSCDKKIDKILGDAGGNLVCIAPNLEVGGGIQLIQIEKMRKQT
jgi:hypothetical protein